jgi:hypothetical protein
MHERSEKGRLTILRLYEVGNGAAPRLATTVTEHKRKAVIQRFTSSDSVPDISIIWAPGSGSTRSDVAPKWDTPAVELRSSGAVPICGLRFTTRGGTWVDRVSVVPPASVAFGRMCDEFDSLWKRASTTLDG